MASLLTKLRVYCGLAIILTVAGAAGADVRLPKVFADNMVLQRHKPIPVWGWAAVGEKVVVEFNGKQSAAVANKSGKWKLRLPVCKAGGPYVMTVRGKTTLTFRNVMVGDVWFCSGQSNMTVQVKQAKDPKKEIAAANYPNIRFFHLNYDWAHLRSQPQDDLRGKSYKWTVCSPKTVAPMSAVAYYFARELQKSVKVPIGLIHSSWGGTAIYSWCPRELLQKYPHQKASLAGWDAQWAEYYKTKDPAKYPNRYRKGNPAMFQPAGLWNGGVAPFIPYGIKGVIWYQGESNAGNPAEYRTIFPAMIRAWRKAWGRRKLPFLFVQLANYYPRSAQPQEHGWAGLREAQEMALVLPNTGMAVAIDIGDAKNIHPLNKQDVGKRLALAARVKAYGQKIPYAGPTYSAMKRKGGKVRVLFVHTDGGLKVKDGDKPIGFAIAGKDKKFHWAEAKIEGNSVIVWSPKVPKPKVVRYAWGGNPACNLYNGAGLPAAPFRTDAPLNPNLKP